jgi:hypothetical protein
VISIGILGLIIAVVSEGILRRFIATILAFVIVCAGVVSLAKVYHLRHGDIKVIKKGSIIEKLGFFLPIK